MRVISGYARGKKIKEPVDFDIRPTTDMVKESIFNIIQFYIEGRSVLDLFGGTGQLGIEALSRGASGAVFVDESRKSARLIKENLKATGLEENARVVIGDSLKYLENSEKFDIIFLDPPYATELLENAIEKVIKFDILKENGIIICESKIEKVLPEVPLPYRKNREYKYGKIKITTFTKNSDS